MAGILERELANMKPGSMDLCRGRFLTQAPSRGLTLELRCRAQSHPTAPTWVLGAPQAQGLCLSLWLLISRDLQDFPPIESYGGEKGRA